MMFRNVTSRAALTLSHDLLWTDEHGWSPVVTQVDYTLTGAMVVENAERQAGRPITLAPPNTAMAFHTRVVVDTLRAWACVPGQEFHLTLDDGRGFTVVFRHQDAPAIEAKPVCGFPTFEADDYWQVTLKLMEI